MRLAYLGTPAMAVPPLVALHDAGFDIALVVTRADARRGRGSAVSPSPVKDVATSLGIPVTSDVDDVLGAGADLGVVVAFGRLIKPHVLAALPMVNVHFSLLPRWRGAAPVERAILAGDEVTGVCLMAVEEGLDTGPVYSRTEVPIVPRETAASLREKLVALATPMLVTALSEGLGEAEPQLGEPTYAAKLTIDELVIDWTRPAVDIDRLVRVGGAWTMLRGKRLKVHATELAPTGVGVVVPTGDGRLELLEVQPEGRPRLAAREWANGVRWDGTERLGQ